MTGSVTEAETTAKRQFLVHIETDLIRRLKIMAIERDVTASSLVQNAVMEFLQRQDAVTPIADYSEAVTSATTGTTIR